MVISNFENAFFHTFNRILLEAEDGRWHSLDLVLPIQNIGSCKLDLANSKPRGAPRIDAPTEGKCVVVHGWTFDNAPSKNFCDLAHWIRGEEILR